MKNIHAADTPPETPGETPPRGVGLREGFTTGSALTAAAMAALRLLLRGEAPDSVTVPLPPFTADDRDDRVSGSHGDNGGDAAPAGWLDVPVETVARLDGARAGTRAALGVVIKDGGDDPDATHRARIEALVECAPAGMPLPQDVNDLPEIGDGLTETGNGSPDILGLPDLPDLPDTPVTPGMPDLLLPFPGGEAFPVAPAISTPQVAPSPPPSSGPCPPRDGVTVLLRGGTGVGRVTLPGLPVAVGEPAINPEPRRQLAFAVHRECAAAGWRGTVRVTARVPEGQRMARHTLNPRLGIVGGISILGTRGTVRPYSHDAWQAAVAQGLDVARAAGLTEVCLSTGRRSETLLMRAYPALPPLAFVQAADFAAFSLAAAAQRGFARVAWGCFFGKLVKLAQGLPHTHAHTAPLDLPLLARWAADAGAGTETRAAVAAANTAGQALELLLTDPAHPAVLRAVARRARDAAHGWTGGAESVTVTVHLFHMDGRCLVTA
ncbi:MULTISPECIES: cobalt-precorrin-5B (C(1))-methyltransferase CbiD [Desulfovibrionaceae]|uniref:cobalt-precorrin-5B (C(1))-methyltransferase CbiD n=1 Tax=Nitratidesulfovibrio sp. SRB-5 TaxID=2872636 RepID=UPI001CBA63D3